MSEFKVGDRVRVLDTATFASIYAGREGTVAEVGRKGVSGAYSVVRLDSVGGDRGIYDNELDLISSEPQPELWTFEEAHDGVSITNEDKETVRFRLNYGTEQITKQAIDKYVLYMSAADDSGGSVAVGLTLADAKALAVGLFNEILYLESLRNTDAS